MNAVVGGILKGKHQYFDPILLYDVFVSYCLIIVIICICIMWSDHNCDHLKKRTNLLIKFITKYIEDTCN